MTTPTTEELGRMLDKAKMRVFLGTNAAFLGSIMCSLEFVWDDTQPTAWTDGLRLGWNSDWFLSLNDDERVGLLVHELWHVARLHQLRVGAKDKPIWNVACDYRINNDLLRDKYKLPSNGVWDPKLDKNGILSEEKIYELLLKKAIPMPTDPMEDLRAGEPTSAQKAEMVAAVVRAVKTAEMAGQAGNLPGDLKEILNTFLEPVVPWRNVLAQWMTELQDSDEFTWKRRNRRFPGVYMPSRDQEESRLEHLAYFQDTSGSITEEDMVRFNSEVKYVQEVLKPDKLTLVQFDTQITYTRVFEADEPFEDVEMHGGGGTSLVPVKRWIEEHKPTAAIVFSDLECSPMGALTQPIPVIWAVIRNPDTTVPFGRVIQIKD